MFERIQSGPPFDPKSVIQLISVKLKPKPPKSYTKRNYKREHQRDKFKRELTSAEFMAIMNEEPVDTDYPMIYCRFWYRDLKLQRKDENFDRFEKLNQKTI